MVKVNVDDIFDVFNLPRRTEASEHLVSIRLAITINLKLEKQSVLEQIEVYKTVWYDIAAEYQSTKHDYVVEYCKSGSPHIHGTMECMIPHKAYIDYPDEQILRMFAKSIFLKLPKKYYKQFGKAKINEFFGVFKTPAVCVKMPRILSSGWEDYKKKTQ